MRVWIGVLLCLLLTGCGSSQDSFTWQATTQPVNLDPQVTQEEGDLLVLRHLYRGLFRTDAQGQPQPDGCREYQVSRDGLVWTFTLSPDLVWWDGLPVTAQDYAYGISRALDPTTGSPYQPVLEGIHSLDCPQEDTLVVTLDRPLNLPRLLSLAGSYPCREDFFQSTQGQYGLTRETTLGCGVYELKSWGDTLVTLTRCQGEGIDTLRIAGPDWSGTPTGALVPAEEGDGLPLLTWALCLNPQRQEFTQLSLRQGIASALYSASLPLEPPLVQAGQLFPPALGEEDCLPELGAPGPLLWEGLEALGLDGVKGLTLLAPDDPPLLALAQALNQELQHQLGIFCSLETVDQATLAQRLEEGDYDLALAPFQPQFGDPQVFLESCARLMDSQAQSQEELLAECGIIPLCWEEFQLETQEPVEGLWVSPYTGSPDFTQAQYK